MKNTCPKDQRAACIALSLKVLGEKWTAVALQHMDEKAQTFSELELALVGISPRTLSNRLNKLENENIVEKREYTTHPPRYKYGLTAKGKELHSVLSAMANWGYKYQ